MSKRGFKAAATQPPPKKLKHQLRATASWRLLPLSWHMASRHSLPTFIIVLLPPLLMQLGIAFIDLKHIDRWTVFGFWVVLLGFILTIINSVVTYYLQLQLAYGRAPGVIECYRASIRYALRLVGFSALYSFIIIVGLLLFVVPGLKALRRYTLTPFFIIDTNKGIRESMQLSAQTTEPYARQIWGALLIIVLGSGLSFGLRAVADSYGAFAGSLLAVFYIYLPALRYRECALQLPATSIKDESGVAIDFVGRYSQTDKIWRRFSRRPRQDQ